MKRKSVGAILILLVLFTVAFLSGRAPDSTLPGAFAQGGFTLEPGQTTGKLLVVDGDAFIAGRVEGWLAVVGGSLHLDDQARVSGPMLVFGGDVAASPGFRLTGPGWLAFPQGSPLIPLLVWTLAITVMVAVLGTALLGWLAVRLACKLGLTEWLRRFIEYNRERWSALFIVSGLAVSAFLLAVFVHLAEETVYQHEAALIDNLIFWLVHNMARPALDKAMIAVTYTGSGYAYFLLAPPLLAFLFFRGLRHEAASLAICFAGAAFLNWVLKHLFERARPEMFRVISESGYSFPSGHAMVSLCFYGMLAYIAGRRLKSRSRQAALYAFTGLMVVVIGFSRIYLGVHYPSDIAGGYLAGGTWLAFCISFLWWWELKK